MSTLPEFADDVWNGIEEIARGIKVSPRRALYLCYTGQVPAFKEGRLWRLRSSRYLASVAEREEANIARAK